LPIVSDQYRVFCGMMVGICREPADCHDLSGASPIELGDYRHSAVIVDEAKPGCHFMG
jgi:hypothetical protein